MSRRTLFGWLLLLLPPATSLAAPRQVTMVDFVQDIWDAGENGPPHPGVTAIHQSRDGYLWVGTFGGVARFDGVQFRAPEVADPAARAALADHIRCISETPDGGLWFGTRRSGAVRMKDGHTLVVTRKDGLPNQEVRAIAVTKDGTTWLATSEGLAAMGPSGRIERYGTEQGLPADDIGSLLVEGDGTFWVGTAHFGVARFDGTRFQPRPLEIPKTGVRDQAFGLAFESVGTLARDEGGVLWAGTSAGLLPVPEPGTAPSPAHPSAVNHLAASRRGGLWASTGGGLGRLEHGRWVLSTSREGLVNDDLLTVHEDREGSVWLGSRMGLIRLRRRTVRTYSDRDALGGSGANCVLEARNGDLWVGHRGGAARRHDGRWIAVGADQGLPHAAVRSVAETPDGVIWLGTSEGLARYENGRVTARLGEGPRYAVRALATDRHGQLWVATANGLDRLDGRALRRVLPRERLCDPTQITTLYVDGEDAIWIGGNTALTRIRNGAPECLRDDAVATRNDVRTVYQDVEGRVWIGSIGGLSRFAEGVRTPLTGLSGPFATSIYGMLDDGRGAYWVSTPQGLFRIDKARIPLASDPVEGQTVYRAFGTADGMDTPVGAGGGAPTAWRGADGTLYFTTVLGIAIVDPTSIEEETYRAPIYVEGLLADRRSIPVAPNEPPHLTPGTRDVEVQFAMLSFVAPERIQYKYRLEGYDRDWVTSGSRRVAYYTNLRPGRYHFRVVAANHRNIWNQTGASLEIELLPHFYERTGFRVAGGLGLALLAFAGYSWRVHRLRVHERQLEQRVQEAVAQIQTLKGLLPICASCKKIRDDSGYWNQMETYIHNHSGVDFSHSICPDCMVKLYPDYAARAGQG